jgi:hypothetical protein
LGKWKVEIEEEHYHLTSRFKEEESSVQFQFFREGVEDEPLLDLTLPAETEEEGELLRKQLLINFFREIRFNYQFDWEEFQERFLEEVEGLQSELKNEKELLEQIEQIIHTYLKSSDDSVKGVALLRVSKLGDKVRVTSFFSNNFQIEKEELERIGKFIIFSNNKATPIKGAPLLTVVEIGELFYFYSPLTGRVGVMLITINSRLGIFLKAIESIKSQMKPLFEQ